MMACVWNTLRGESQTAGNSPLRGSRPTLNTYSLYTNLTKYIILLKKCLLYVLVVDETEFVTSYQNFPSYFLSNLGGFPNIFSQSKIVEFQLETQKVDKILTKMTDDILMKDEGKGRTRTR